MDGETLPIMVGPWGGSEGDPFYLAEPPKRLESIVIQVATVINSIGFTYVDTKGQKRTVGPVFLDETEGDGFHGKLTRIQFAPTEYVTELAGSMGYTLGTWVVTYLKIQTNLQTHRAFDIRTAPFGTRDPNTGTPLDFLRPAANTFIPLPDEKEIPFSVPLPENASIVGFFGRQGSNLLNAIGVYVKPSKSLVQTDTSQDKTTETGPIKIGAWGGEGGTPFDVTQTPKRLESVTIRTGNSIDSIGFSYVDQAGQKHSAGPFGGTGGQPTTIELEPEEYVKKISGTKSSSSREKTFVTSLEIETNIRTYGPYGKESKDYPFNIPLPEKNSSIVGFFGRAGQLLDAIGVYISYPGSTAPPRSLTITGQTAPIMVGAWGGYWGRGGFFCTEPSKRVDSVTIRAGDYIDSFGFSYIDQADQKHTVGPNGGNGGSLTTIQLGPTEYVVKLSGTTGTTSKFGGLPVVASLVIETNLQTYGPYGKEQDMQFSVPLPENASIVGFFGAAPGNQVDAIGAYVSGFITN